jgi:hypothetical protein
MYIFYESKITTCQVICVEYKIIQNIFDIINILSNKLICCSHKLESS